MAIPDEKMLEEILRENKRLKAELARQKELFEKTNLELVKSHIETQQESEYYQSAATTLRQAVEDTIVILEKIIELHAPGYAEHAKRVLEGCKFLARELELDNDTKTSLYIAARIHEIGKVGIPDEILRKNRNELTLEELKQLNTYPLYGQKLFENLKNYELISNTIRHFKEKYDGSGFPDGLVGRDIPLTSRILAVAESFDTMFTKRSHGVTGKEVYNRMTEMADEFFDPHLVELYEVHVSKVYCSEKIIERLFVPLEDLQAGMTLAISLNTLSGIKLVPKGTVLDTELIEKIRSYALREPLEKVFIYKK